MKNLFFILITAVLFFACKPTKVLVEKPDLSNREKVFETELSSVNIPIRISVLDMQNTLNKELVGELYSAKGRDGGMDYEYTVKKSSDILLDLDGDKLAYTIPIVIDVKGKAFGVERETTVSSVMKFKTGISVNEDWVFEPETDMVGFKVLNDPKISLGFLDLSVKGLIEKGVVGSKKLLEKSIDEEIAYYFPKKEDLVKTWKEIQQPYLLSEEYSAWVVAKPQAVRMTPIRGERNHIVANVGVETYLDIIVGEKPYVETNDELPALDLGNIGSDLFKIAIGTQFDYRKATEVLKNNFVGYEYYYKKKKKIVIRDIEVYGNGDDIVIGMDFDGNIEGMMYMVGTPAYDKVSEKIYIDNFRFDAKTKNALLNVAEVLVKGPFKKKIEGFMTFSIRDELAETQKMIDESLKENSFDDKLHFQCNILKIEPREILLTNEGMQVMLAIIGESSLIYGKK